MKAVVTVIGKDKVGIIADVAVELKSLNINIIDISQTVMQDFFTMMMMVELKDCSLEIEQVAEKLKKLGDDLGMEIIVRHEDIFKAMHRV